MSRRSLQKDNKDEKIKKHKKKSFFSVSDETPAEEMAEVAAEELKSLSSESSDAETPTEDKVDIESDSRFELLKELQKEDTSDDDGETDDTDEEDAPKKNRKKKNKPLTKKRFVIRVMAFLVLVTGVFIGARIASSTEFIEESKYGLPEEMIGEATPYVPDIYPADWETDIFTYQPYLDLIPDRVKYRLGGNIDYLYDDTIKSKGDGLVFIKEYFDAIKHGDHEKLNSMYMSSYFKQDGNKKHSAFPMQKVFNIAVELRNDIIEKEDEKLRKTYDIYYFVVRYNILNNDGLFRDDIDEHVDRAQLIKVLVDYNGVGKIDDIWDIPAYTGDLYWGIFLCLMRSRFFCSRRFLLCFY